MPRARRSRSVRRRSSSARRSTRHADASTSRAGSGIEPGVSFSGLTLRRLGRSIHMFATCVVRRQAGTLAAMLILLLLGINGLNVLNSYVGRDFMTAIEQRDRSQVLRTALLYVGVFGISTVAAVMYSFAEQR